ncbi:hypothetical protein OUZ56_016359 [Daphnia magna]|uniref:Uncharacterized protein n=1 Tax=Daphnia magna TaxID=35525 RepID=A0ABR0AQI8_9CRUS|nr:hypothetical protein OUZ56_016359 [Daphnia magna]
MNKWAVLRIVSIGIPFFSALDAAAPLVEWAEKMGSTPASVRMDFIHRPTVDPVTDLKGLIVAINSN